MSLLHLTLTLTVSLLAFPVPAIAADWIEVASENFVLYTDTDARKATRLLQDLEARYAAFSAAFLPLDPRQVPIQVFLMDNRDELRDSVPESVLKRVGEMLGDPRLIADRSGYLVYSPTGTFILGRDHDPSDIADDVAHSLGHLLLARSTLWQPFWLQEGVGEYMRLLGRGRADDAVSSEDAYSVEDLLTIVPREDYNDLEDGGTFRQQSYHLLRVLMENHSDQFRAYLRALGEEDGSGATPELDESDVAEKMSSYTDTALSLMPVDVSAPAREMSAAESVRRRGDLLVASGRHRAATYLYEQSSADEARVGLAILSRLQRESAASRRSLEVLAREFPEAGLLHYHLGTMRAETDEQRKTQIAALERAVDLMPRMGRALAELAFLHAVDGRPQEALPLLDRAIELEPESADRSYEVLAEAEMLLGDYTRAGEAAAIAAELPHHDPASRERFLLLVRTFYRRMELHRRAAEAERVEELRREVEELAREVDPRPVAAPPEPAPIGRISIAVTSGRPRDITSPKLVSSMLPDYPADLRRRGVEGRIVLEIDLDRRGRTEDVRVLRSDIRELNDASVAAVREWVFQPARRRNESISFSFRLTLRFYLE
jgi:TonB family protein